MYDRPPSGDFDNYSLRWSPPPKERGGCLTLWLAVSTIFSLLSVVAVCQAISLISRRQLSSGATFGVVVLSVLIVGQMICLWGIWNWKKWGVYGIAAISVISPIIEFTFGRPDMTDCIAPFIQLGILYILVKDRWEQFR